MKLIAIAAGLALAAAAPAAQADPASAPAAPGKMALAHQLLDVSGGQDRAAVLLRTMMGTIYKGLEKNMPPDQARLMEHVQIALQDEMVGIIPQLMEVSERIYAEDLTEKELTDELAWLQSESGRSIRQKTPLMVQQMAQAEVPLLQAMLPRLGQRIVDRVCAEAKCSEHDRQIVTAAMTKAMTPHPG